MILKFLKNSFMENSKIKIRQQKLFLKIEF
jgi:hypothetical protein